MAFLLQPEQVRETALLDALACVLPQQYLCASLEYVLHWMLPRIDSSRLVCPPHQRRFVFWADRLRPEGQACCLGRFVIPSVCPGKKVGD